MPPPSGAFRIDDWHHVNPPAGPPPMQGEQLPPMVDILGDEMPARPANGKKAKADKKAFEPVETMFEGTMLEKAEPLIGGKLTWARVGKRSLPFDEKKLVALVREHRQQTRSGPAADFSRLSSNQQGVITRLIEERQLQEKNGDADWILVDVVRYGVPHFFTRPMDVRKLRVILKR